MVLFLIKPLQWGDCLGMDVDTNMAVAEVVMIRFVFSSVFRVFYYLCIENIFK